MAHGKYGWRIAGFIFKGLCSLVIIGVVCLIAWRIIDRNIDPKPMKTITPNDTLCEAYKEYGDKLTVYYQDQNEYTQESDKNYGYFANGGTRIIKEADQIQFVLRYNNSTVKHTAEDYKYYEVKGNSFQTHSEAIEAAREIDIANPLNHIKEIIPDLSREDDLYDVTLTFMYDLTPDNPDDNDGKTPEAVRYERFFPTGDPVSYQKTLYNYRKFIFDNAVIDDSVLAIYVDIYYVGDKNYEETPYGSLLIYYYEDDNISYKLSKNDVNALEEYTK
ncbi:MAG: hypothetical protein IJY39_12190 [Clostridia bacterium]|nr:hypothetical protein [Clostridia bacterium]